MKHDEHNLQVSCMQWLMYQHRDIWELATAIPNGGMRPRKMINGRLICVEGSRLKSEGLKAGVSDVIVFKPTRKHHALHIEFKTQKGTQSQAQKIWEKKMIDNNYQYCIVRSFEEFKKVIEDYVKTNKEE